MLQRAGIDAVVGELEAAGVAQHVRMNGKGKFGQFPSPADHFQEPGPGHRPAAFGVAAVMNSPKEKAPSSGWGASEDRA